MIYADSSICVADAVGVAAIISEIRTRLPDAKIVLSSVLPCPTPFTLDPFPRVAATTPTVVPVRRTDAGPEVSAALADDHSLTTFAWIGEDGTLVVREAT